MSDHKGPPGYIPLTIHEIGGDLQPGQRSNGRGRAEHRSNGSKAPKGDRSRQASNGHSRHNGHSSNGNGSGPHGNGKRRPQQRNGRRDGEGNARPPRAERRPEMDDLDDDE